MKKGLKKVLSLALTSMLFLSMTSNTVVVKAEKESDENDIEEVIDDETLDEVLEEELEEVIDLEDDALIEETEPSDEEDNEEIVLLQLPSDDRGGVYVDGHYYHLDIELDGDFYYIWSNDSSQSKEDMNHTCDITVTYESNKAGNEVTLYLYEDGKEVSSQTIVSDKDGRAMFFWTSNSNDENYVEGSYVLQPNKTYEVKTSAGKVIESTTEVHNNTADVIGAFEASYDYEVITSKKNQYTYLENVVSDYLSLYLTNTTETNKTVYLQELVVHDDGSEEWVNVNSSDESFILVQLKDGDLATLNIVDGAMTLNAHESIQFSFETDGNETSYRVICFEDDNTEDLITYAGGGVIEVENVVYSAYEVSSFYDDQLNSSFKNIVENHNNFSIELPGANSRESSSYDFTFDKVYPEPFVYEGKEYSMYEYSYTYRCTIGSSTITNTNLHAAFVVLDDNHVYRCIPGDYYEKDVDGNPDDYHSNEFFLDQRNNHNYRGLFDFTDESENILVAFQSYLYYYDEDGQLVESEEDTYVYDKANNATWHNYNTCPQLEGYYDYVINNRQGNSTYMGVDLTFDSQEIYYIVPTMHTHYSYVVHDSEAIEVVLEAKKELIGRDLKEGEFTFSIKDEKGKVVSTGTNDSDGNIKFSGITYDQNNSGKHTYTISEDSGELKEIKYDESTFEVTVYIRDEEGTLTYLVEYPDNGIVFYNHYETHGSLKLEATKELSGRDLKEGEFTFSVKDEKGNLLSTGYNDENGKVLFTEIFYDLEDIGEHTYTITEDVGLLEGVTYDKSSYEIGVSVEDNGDGTLAAYASYPEGEIVFRNSYKAYGSIRLEGTKKLTGRDLKEGEFTFTIYNVAGVPVATGTNDTNGKILFTEIQYNQKDVGRHNYTIYEDRGKLEGVTYDRTVYIITITVEDNGDGTLTTKSNYSGNEIIFRNSYQAAGVLTIEGTKCLNGRELVEGEFSFIVTDEFDESKGVIARGKNDVQGNIIFDDIKYNLSDVGTYTYLVSEVKGDSYAVSYDPTLFAIVVNVEDDGNGQLIVEAKYPENGIVFRNDYSTVNVSGEKSWDDKDNEDHLRPESITVNLLADGDACTSMNVIPDNQGNWTFEFTDLPKYNNGKEIVYSVTENVVNGYESIVAGDSDDGFMITNTQIPLPELSKFVSDKDYNESFGKVDEADNDDMMEYKIVVDHISLAKELIIHDFLDKQLDISTIDIKSVTLYRDKEDSGTPLTQDINYHYIQDSCSEGDPGKCDLEGCSFEIDIFDQSVLTDLTDEGYVEVIFDIRLNESINDYNQDFVDEINNYAGLSYQIAFRDYEEGEYEETDHDEVETYSYGFNIFKYTDNDKPLEGAQFIISKADNDAIKYAQFKEIEGIYLLTRWLENKESATSLVSNGDGFITIEGLHDGTFFVEESIAPDGYQLAKDIITVSLIADKDFTIQITVNDLEIENHTVPIKNEVIPDEYEEDEHEEIETTVTDDEELPEIEGEAEEIEAVTIKTNDDTNLLIYIAGIALSLAIIRALYLRKKHE